MGANQSQSEGFRDRRTPEDGSETPPELAPDPSVDWSIFPGQSGCSPGSLISNSPSNLGFGLAGLAAAGGSQCQAARQTARSLHQISATSYPAFLASVQELNAISEHFLDSNGEQLVFAVKKGTDSTILWKATVRVAAVKVDAATKAIDSYRCLSLKQYLRVYNALKTQSAAVKDFGTTDASCFSVAAAARTDQPTACPSRSSIGSRPQAKTQLKVDFDKELGRDRFPDIDPSSLDECCICLERKPDVILPCTHSYCLPCIEQWNVDHKTCPVCRETLNSTDDGWVISEGPDSIDIATEIQKSLMNLVD